MVPGANSPLWSVLPIWVAILVALVWSVRREGSGSFVHDLGLRWKAVDAVTGLCCGVALAVLGIALTSLISGRSPFGGAGFSVSSGSLPLTYWIMPIAITLGAAALEESLFRGLIQPACIRLAESLGGKPRAANVIGISVTTVCFVACHLLLNSSGGAASVVVLVLVSLVCGDAALVAGRVGPAFAIHAVFNVSGVVFDLIPR